MKYKIKIIQIKIKFDQKKINIKKKEGCQCFFKNKKNNKIKRSIDQHQFDFFFYSSNNQLTFL